MAEVLFYHLEQAKLETVLPDLLAKTLERGWRATVRVGADDKLEHLENLLWTYADESFLPHGSAGDSTDHPVWLTTETDLDANRDLLFLVEGAEVELAEIEHLTRCISIFDGADENALNKARQFWKDLKGSEHQPTYWRQSVQGRWEKQG
ncbi:DNA polymerase III subunit chi [Parvularcula sp. IMCC14364]|uniref:DNA polymerase III subunit chi n=1 Tax=Parvularcula sp. IMCC14364 TaxID=3067902 RepID=UPI00274283CC|nr:DNA polymerase III subunit chi [Parvularcula sp. IMCC14364]